MYVRYWSKHLQALVQHPPIRAQLSRLATLEKPSGSWRATVSREGRTPHYGGLAEQDLPVRLGSGLGLTLTFFSGIRLAPRGNHGPIAVMILLPTGLVGPCGFDAEMDLVASRLDGRHCAQAAVPMAENGRILTR
jgi:hypothetical protein